VFIRGGKATNETKLCQVRDPSELSVDGDREFSTGNYQDRTYTSVKLFTKLLASIVIVFSKVLDRSGTRLA